MLQLAQCPFIRQELTGWLLQSTRSTPFQGGGCFRPDIARNTCAHTKTARAWRLTPPTLDSALQTQSQRKPALKRQTAGARPGSRAPSGASRVLLARPARTKSRKGRHCVCRARWASTTLRRPAPLQRIASAVRPASTQPTRVQRRRTCVASVSAALTLHRREPQAQPLARHVRLGPSRQQGMLKCVIPLSSRLSLTDFDAYAQRRSRF